MPKKSLKSFFKQFICGSSINDSIKHNNLPESSIHEPSSPKISWTGQIKRKSTTTTTTTTTNSSCYNKDTNNNNNDINNTSNRFISASTNVKSSRHSNRYTNLVKNLITSPAIDVAPINKPLGHSNRHTNVHNLFSSKNKNHTAIDVASINNNKVVLKRSHSWDGRRRMKSRSKKYNKNSSDDHDIERDVAIGYLDPPLPVVKCPPRDQEENVNLGKRRGFQMKSLQIEPIQMAMNRHTNNNSGAFSVPTSATNFS